MTPGTDRRLAGALVLLAALAGTGCAARWAHRQGQEEARKGNWDMAVARYTRALQKDPDNVGYKIALETARIQASREHYGLARKHLAADDLDRAADELEIASKYDPSNKSAADDLVIVRSRVLKRDDEKRRLESFDEVTAQAATRSPVPVLSPRSTNPISLKWDNQSLKKLFETLGKLAGVNVVFDEGFRDKPETVNLAGVTFQEALDQITFVSRLFYKVLDQNTVIIVPESQAKRRQYDPVLLRTFYLRNAELKEVEAIVKTALGAQARVASNPTLSALTILGTTDELALASRVIELNDKGRGEVVVEVEILEVNRDRLKAYGIRLANTDAYTAAVTFAPTRDPSEEAAGLLTARAHLLSSLNLSDFVVTIPSTLLTRFLQTDSTVRILASPRLRASEGKKTSLKIGQEVPVPVTTFQATQTGGGTFTPATSFQYRNVGINLELTPRVTAAGEITLEMAAEFSLPGAVTQVAGTTLPSFLTRNVNGILRVRDGETTLVGGLLQERETEALSGVFGLQSVPILNRVFAGNDKRREQTEILITMTPHLVRAPKITVEDLVPTLIGTREIVSVPSSRGPLFGEPLASPRSPTPGPAIGRPSGTVSPSLAAPGQETTPAAPPTPTPQTLPTPIPPPTPAPEASPVPEAPVPEAPVPEATPSPEPPRPPSDPPPTGSLAASFSPGSATVKVGETVPIGLVVVGGRDLTSAEVVIGFDPTVVDAIDVTAGPLLTLDGSAVGVERQMEPGRLRARFTRATPAAGSGVFATVTLRGVRAGTSPVAAQSLVLSGPMGPLPATLPPPAQVVVSP